MNWPQYVCPNQQTVAQNLGEIRIRAIAAGRPDVANVADMCLAHQPAQGQLTPPQHVLKVQNSWDESRTTSPDWEWIKKELDHA